MDAMAQLPVEFREVIVLRELEELSYKEISVAMEIPIGTVMSRLARGRKRLQESLFEPSVFCAHASSSSRACVEQVAV
jgi:RNA polymerase sigma-70 factor (ECF subfamily)